MWHKVGNWIKKETGKAAHWWKSHNEGVRKVWRGAHHAAQTLDSWGVPLAGKVSKWMGKAERIEKTGQRYYKKAHGDYRKGRKLYKKHKINTRLGHARRTLKNKDVLRHTIKRHFNQSQIGLHPTPISTRKRRRRPDIPTQGKRRRRPDIPTGMIGLAQRK